MARFEKKVYIEIDRYLRGKMTPQERMDYEIKLSLDPELEKEVRFQDFLVRSLAYGRRKQLHKYLYENASTKLWGNAWGKTGTIISLVVVLGAAIAFFVVKNNRADRVDLPDADDTRLERQQDPVRSTAPLSPADTAETDTLPEDTQSAAEEENGFEAIPPTVAKKPNEEPKEFLQETSVSDDTIQGDALIKEVVLRVSKLEQSIADTLGISANEKTDITYGSYTVQLWKSPVNFRGYKIEQNKITLYGLDKSNRLLLKKQGNNLYLLTGSDVFELQQTSSFRPLKPLTPPAETDE